jgi:folate-binding protein YgfZ
MADITYAHLEDRGIVRVGGGDAVELLDGLVTNALAGIDKTGAIHTGLLSPQGKILFDFFVTRDGDDLLIDVAKASLPDLVKRLGFYRLRADATFSDQSEELVVAAAWGAADIRFPGGILAYADPRQAGMGWRMILPAGRLAELPGRQVEAAAYHAHRIGVGVPEAGRDFVLGDTFPHEALYDQLAGVDFRKGCYVGQEVVSRMQHRGTARKRIVPVEGQAALAEGGDIMAGEATIGRLGSTSGSRGLALVRLDRAHEAGEKGTPLEVGGLPVVIAKPSWLHVDLATGRAEEQQT